MVLLEAPSARSGRTSNSRGVNTASVFIGAACSGKTSLTTAFSLGAANCTLGRFGKQGGQSIRKIRVVDLNRNHDG